MGPKERRIVDSRLIRMIVKSGQKTCLRYPRKNPKLIAGVVCVSIAALSISASAGTTFAGITPRNARFIIFSKLAVGSPRIREVSRASRESPVKRGRVNSRVKATSLVRSFRHRTGPFRRSSRRGGPTAAVTRAYRRAGVEGGPPAGRVKGIHKQMCTRVCVCGGFNYIVAAKSDRWN